MRIEYKRLKDCCSKIGSGATPKGGSSVYIDSGVSLIRSQNVYNLKFSYSGLAHINDEAANKLKGVIVNKGDVLLNITGDSVARTCVVPDEVLPARVNQHVSIIRPNKDVDSRYLNYYLASPAMQGYLLNIASTGASRNAITKGMIEKLVIPFPDMDSQRRIASILSAYDNLIENNNKRIRLLEQMAEILYKEWFVRFRFPGHENVEFENGLPKGWKIWSISKLCDINRKTLNSKNKGLEIEYLDTSSITCNQIVGTESYVFEEAPSRARRIVKHNSIVFSTVRPNLKHYGLLKNIPDNLIVSTGFAVFDSKYDIANIIYLFLSSQEVVDYCQLIAEGAVATYPSIKPEEIGRLKIALPNIEIAEKWNGKLESLYSEILNIQKQNTLLTRQRDLLLPRLMSGKLEVKI